MCIILHNKNHYTMSLCIFFLKFFFLFIFTGMFFCVCPKPIRDEQKLNLHKFHGFVVVVVVYFFLLLFFVAAVNLFMFLQLWQCFCTTFSLIMFCVALVISSNLDIYVLLRYENCLPKNVNPNDQKKNDKFFLCFFFASVFFLSR